MLLHMRDKALPIALHICLAYVSGPMLMALARNRCCLHVQRRRWCIAMQRWARVVHAYIMYNRYSGKVCEDICRCRKYAPTR